MCPVRQGHSSHPHSIKNVKILCQRHDVTQTFSRECTVHAVITAGACNPTALLQIWHRNQRTHFVEFTSAKKFLVSLMFFCWSLVQSQHALGQPQYGYSQLYMYLHQKPSDRGVWVIKQKIYLLERTVIKSRSSISSSKLIHVFETRLTTI